MKTHRQIVKGYSRVDFIAKSLIRAIKWFAVAPVHDDDFSIEVKEEDAALLDECVRQAFNEFPSP